MCIRDSFVTQLFMYPELEDRTLLWGQFLHHQAEVFALLLLFQVELGCCGSLADRLSHFNKLLSIGLHMIDAVIGGDPIEPRLQTRLSPEVRQMLERFYENILGEVAGIVGVGREAIAEAID